MHASIYGPRRPPQSPTIPLVLVEGGGHASENFFGGLAVDHVEGCAWLVEILRLLCENADEFRGLIEDVVQFFKPGRLEGVPVLLCAPEEFPTILRFLTLLVINCRVGVDRSNRGSTSG